MSPESRISHIFVSPVPDSEKRPMGGYPMVELQIAKLIEGLGIQSVDGNIVDRYAQGRGSYSRTRLEVRQLSLITQDAINRANQSRRVEYQFSPAETRRNIVIDGMTAEELNNLLGKLIALGAVEVRGVELCEPCERPSALSGKKGFGEAFINKGGESTGGLRVTILSSGIVRVNDRVLEIKE